MFPRTEKNISIYRLSLAKFRSDKLPQKFSATFALVTRRPYCSGGPKRLCFTTLSLIPMVSIARLSVVKQSSFGLPGQYGRRVTRVNSVFVSISFPGPPRSQGRGRGNEFVFVWETHGFSNMS